MSAAPVQASGAAQPASQALALPQPVMPAHKQAQVNEIWTRVVELQHTIADLRTQIGDVKKALGQHQVQPAAAQAGAAQDANAAAVPLAVHDRISALREDMRTTADWLESSLGLPGGDNPPTLYGMLRKIELTTLYEVFKRDLESPNAILYFEGETYNQIAAAFRDKSNEIIRKAITYLRQHPNFQLHIIGRTNPHTADWCTLDKENRSVPRSLARAKYIKECILGGLANADERETIGRRLICEGKGEMSKEADPNEFSGSQVYFRVNFRPTHEEAVQNYAPFPPLDLVPLAQAPRARGVQFQRQN